MQVALAGTNGHVRPVRIALICAAACTLQISSPRTRMPSTHYDRLTQELCRSRSQFSALASILSSSAAGKTRSHTPASKTCAARAIPASLAWPQALRAKDSRQASPRSSACPILDPCDMAPTRAHLRAASAGMFPSAPADDFPQASLLTRVGQWKHGKHTRYASCFSLSSPKQTSAREPICICRSNGKGAQSCDERTCKNGKSM